MTAWERILETSERVWFSRQKTSDQSSSLWIPLRKCDCAALNNANAKFTKALVDGEEQIDGIHNINVSSQVLIESGRATADLQKKVIRNNFYNTPNRELTSAIWYKVDMNCTSNSKNKSSSNDSNSFSSSLSNHDSTMIFNDHGDPADAKTAYATSNGNSIQNYLVPITSLADEAIIERLYQEAVSAIQGKLGSKGKYALDYVCSKEIDLQDDHAYKVYIFKSKTGVLHMRKRPKSLISLLEGYTELQRGYSNYIIAGEEEECALGPVRHLSFVIHGIGEALWSTKDVSSPSLIDEVNYVRKTIYKKMYNQWKMECEKVKKANLAEKNKAPMRMPPPPNRIEFIPIEWYEQIHSSSSVLKNDLIAATLTTVPKLRRIANDVIFDVLVYNTPDFCGKVLDCVTTQISDLHDQFQMVHPDFVKEGACSIVGHSLGSVITWDLLSILSDNIGTNDDDLNGNIDKKQNYRAYQRYDIKGYNLPSHTNETNGYEAYITRTESELDETSAGTWGPSTLQRMTRTIPFVPSFTFLLGSPIGLFLTLRGARPLFHQMSLNDDTLQQSKKVKEKISYNHEDFISVGKHHQSSPFHLPSGSLYNIFSPSDPVAYRIEPLLVPNEYPHELPPPCFLAPGGKGVRFHVKAKEIGDNIMKSFSGLIKTSLDKIPEKLQVPSITKNNLADTIGPVGLTSRTQLKKDNIKWKFALGGHSDRVDYQLQPGVIDNEYVAAISAHNTYMRNDDLLEFWIECANSKGYQDCQV